MTEVPQVLDKSKWGSGPWQGEADRVEWRHRGLPCLIVRQGFGALCGYVAVPPGHPAHSRDGSEVDVAVHGGLTYSAECEGRICHVPEHGESDRVWWLGFDCAHAWDFVPGLHAKLRQDMLPVSMTYKTIEFVTRQVNSLAEQLADMASSRPLATEGYAHG